MNRLILPLIVLGFASCTSNTPNQILLTESTGKPGKIQVLMEQTLWDGPVGQTIASHFNAYAEGVYLRPETTFDYYHVTPDQFKGALRKTRNILQVRLRDDTTFTSSLIQQYDDLYARGQFFVQIVDSDPIRLLETVRQEMYGVVDMYNASEHKRLVDEYSADYHKNIDEIAQKTMELSIHVPKKSELKVSEDDFMWIKHDRSQTQLASQNNQFDAGVYWIQQGIVIWETPYKDTSQLSVQGILNDRDTTLKYNVPGKVKGSYMGTEYDEYYSPEAQVLEYKGAYAVKIQGLWKHLGDEAAFGGGPFIQMTIHNEKRNTLVTVCGYVYAPKFDKREYLRELDAMLSTIELL